MNFFEFFLHFSANEQTYQEEMTSAAAGLAGVSGPATPSLTPVPQTTDLLYPKKNQTARHESRLLHYLLAGYNRHVRPVLNHNSNVTVHVGITLTQIFDMVSADDICPLETIFCAVEY